jgi:hypothetical protein
VFETEPVTAPDLRSKQGAARDSNLRLPDIVWKKRTEIAIEIDEIVFVKEISSLSSMTWCDGCANEVVMVTPAQAAAIARVSVRDVNRRVEAGEVHFLEAPDGSLLVCISSLS